MLVLFGLFVSVARTTGSAEVAVEDNACVGQINGSLLVIVSDDAMIDDYANKSDELLDITAPNCIMEAYKEVSYDGMLHAYVPCRSVRYTASFVQKKKPFLVDAATGRGENGPLTTVSSCHTLEADYMAQAIKTMFVNLTNKCMMLLYTENNADYVDQLDTVFIRNDDMSVARCYFEGRITKRSLDELAESLSHNTGGFVLLAGHENHNIIDMSRERGLVDSRNFWIVVTKEKIDVWKDRLRPGERVILLQIPDREQSRCYKFENNTIKRLTSKQHVYHFWIPSLTSSGMEKIGFWSLEKGLTLKRKNVWDFRTFEGKHFTVATLPWPVFHDRIMVDGKMVWHGLCIEILKTLAASLKFTYDLVVPPDRKWGAPMTNGTWNGMVGQVLSGEADFAVAKFTITRLREAVIDFTVPFWHESCVMVMRKPDEKSSLIYLGPFRSEVWYSIFLAIPFIAVALTGLALLRARIHSNTVVFTRKQILRSLHRSVWFAYGALVQQGCVWVPGSQAMRFLVGFWWFFTLVITATYTGNLIAVLAVPKTTLPVNTLQDLASQNVYKYGVVDDTAIYSMIKLSASKVYKKMWKNSVQYKENLVLSHVEGLKRVAAENYIYLGELGGVAPVVFNNCIYAIGKEEFFPSSFAFVFPQKSPYLPFVNKKMIALIENGIIEKWKKEYYPRDMCSLQEKGHKSEPASIQDTQGAFFLLCIGVAIAVLILSVEGVFCLYSKHKNKSTSKTTKRTNILHELVVIRTNQLTR